MDSIVRIASKNYRGGTPLREAVRDALVEEDVPRETWDDLYREACRRLGSRGGKSTAKRNRKKLQGSLFAK